MTRTLSLLTPSGRLTLGNLLGALRPMRERQEHAFYGLSDLHAMTTDHDPAALREHTLEMATLLLAVGLTDATLFRQSRVPAHAQLAYLLECTATTGELNRMVQFKEKGRGIESTRVSLFTYPVVTAPVLAGAEAAVGLRLARPGGLRIARGAAVTAAGLRHLISARQEVDDGYPDRCAGACSTFCQG